MTSSRDRSKEFIEKEDLWPHWPVLPMVNRVARSDDPHSAGIITAGTPTRIYFINMFSLGKGLEGVEHQDFPDVEGLLDAGWLVD